MLGKIPPFVLGPVGVILVLVLAFLGYWFMVKPKQAEIARVEAQIAEEQKKADQKEEAEQGLEKVKREWETSHESLAQKLDERSIPLSMGHPLIAMVNLWREVREDLPRLIEKFVEDSGCVIIEGHPGWEPPMEPYAANTAWIEFPLGAPSGGGQTVAGGGNSPLWVAGTLADIERLYKSLRNFPRILTIHHLGLVRLRELMDTDLYDRVREVLDRPDDEIMVAPLILSVWLACETPDTGGGAAAGGAAGGTGGAPGMGGAGGPPGMGGPGGPPAMGGPGGPSGGGMEMGMPPGGAGPGGPPGGGAAGPPPGGMAGGGGDAGGGDE